MENIHRETNKQIRERKVFLEYVICKAAAVPVAHSLAIYCQLCDPLFTEANDKWFIVLYSPYSIISNNWFI